MTENEFEEYWRKPRDLFEPGSDNGTKSSKRMAALFGIDYKYARYWLNIDLTEDMKRTLKLLVGPNRHTIIKAMEARKGHDQ
jgi:hypothetical protein